MEHRKLICIVGPTAVGKTKASVALAKELNAEIVSADSVQLYRGLNIGSAKPDMVEQDGIPHHVLSCVDIDDPSFSVSSFFTLASNAIEDIQSRGKTVIVTGGSGLYLQSLIAPLNFAIPADPAIREQWSISYDGDPISTYKRLQALDSESASRIHLHDKKRVVRALEVYSASGKPLSSFGGDFSNSARNAPPYDSILFGLTMKRESLYERINQRVDQMIAQGLVAEAKNVYNRNYGRQLPAMQSIGYRQLFDYFDGVCSLNDAVEDIKRETRRFAKRQITWFRRDTRIIWYDADQIKLDAMIQDMKLRFYEVTK